MDCLDVDTFSYTDYLGKWSRMVIIGENVTRNQAAEIILRTCDIYLFTNDSQWRDDLYDALGFLPLKDKRGFPDRDKIDTVRESLGILDINYLQNYQIASCWLGGPHGWCSWDGHIGCDGHNVGKWPSIRRIYDEWKLIAETWKFLKLRCQLWNSEYKEKSSDHETDSESDPPAPVVEFIIENGTVTVANPNEIISHPCNVPIFDLSVVIPGGERGCTLEEFKRAITLSRDSVKHNQIN
jgi:hypothetical protein